MNVFLDPAPACPSCGGPLVYDDLYDETEPDEDDEPDEPIKPGDNRASAAPADT